MSAAHDDGHGGHDDHGHGHSPWIQHHFDDAQHQFDSGKLGIWLFLAQEVLFFSALFVAYILYRHHHPDIYVRWRTVNLRVQTHSEGGLTEFDFELARRLDALAAERGGTTAVNITP